MEKKANPLDGIDCPVCKGDKVGPFVKSDNIKCKICGRRGRLASPEMWINFGNELGGSNVEDKKSI